MEIQIQKNCLVCPRIIRGRSDKKFCSDHCRNIYNNRNRPSESPVVKKIKSYLLSNRIILAEVLAERRTCIVSRADLASRGFHFEFITQAYTSKKGSVVYYCYEYGYKTVSETSVQISKISSK